MSVEGVERKLHITRSLVRNMVIPRTKLPVQRVRVTNNRFKTLQDESVVRSQEEKEFALNEQREKLEKLRLESKLRKAEFARLDSVRKANEALNNLELEAKKQSDYANERVKEVRQEQEADIKALNELILAAKVQAIRDDQMNEKRAIAQVCKNYENELDTVMENERQRGLAKEKEEKEARKQIAMEAKGMLTGQIEQNAENKLLQRIRKRTEGEKERKRLDALLEEEMAEMKKKKEWQQKLRDDLITDNDKLLWMKQYQKKQSKLEDIRIAALMKAKAEKEEAAEAEKKEKKRLRDLEIGRLREMQEEASNIQAEKDALRARRNQEEKERDYRNKEKQEAIRRKEMAEDMERFRQEHFEGKNRLMLARAEVEKEMFAEILERNRQLMIKEEKNRMLKKQGDIQHADHLRKQIEAREAGKVQERCHFFMEGFHHRQEEKLRTQKLDALMTKRLEGLKEYDIPGTYIAHVVRKTAAAAKKLE